jgi:L-threonylcarbamoyladenylate synthase
MLEKVLDTPFVDMSEGADREKANMPVLSPGMKYRHYAPKAPLILVEGEGVELQWQLLALCSEFVGEGNKLGLLLSQESAAGDVGRYPASVVEILGSRKDPATVAKRLFYALRKMDLQQVEVIVAEGFDEKGLGRAVMNRLRKAAVKIVRSGREGAPDKRSEE